MDMVEAEELVVDLAYNLPKRAYKLDQPKPATSPAQAAE
jgi:glucuronate isomerase